jgi:hypothetical protein
VPHLTLHQLTLAVAIVAAVALICFLTVLFLALRLRKVRRQYAVMRGDGTERDIFGIVGRALKQLDGFNRRLDGIVQAQEGQAAVGRLALQNFGIVRYDAFEDMGGRMSFSAAFLDDHGDGMVLTSINGRTETRTYAKPVKELGSEYNLSGEEQAAIQDAAAGRKRSQTRAPATS